MSREKLLGLVDEVIDRSAELSDLWTGTLYEGTIDVHQAALIKAVEKEDFAEVPRLLHNLSEALIIIEKETEESENVS